MRVLISERNQAITEEIEHKMNEAGITTTGGGELSICIDNTIYKMSDPIDPYATDTDTFPRPTETPIWRDKDDDAL